MEALINAALANCGPELLSMLVDSETADRHRREVLLSTAGKGSIPPERCRKISYYYCPEIEIVKEYSLDLIEPSIISNGEGFLTLGRRKGELLLLELDSNLDVVMYRKITETRRIHNPYLLSPDKICGIVTDRFKHVSIPQVALGMLWENILFLEDLNPPFEFVPEKRWLLLRNDLALYNSTTLIDLRDLVDYPGQRIVKRLSGLPHLTGVAGPIPCKDGDLLLYYDELAKIYHLALLVDDIVIGTGWRFPYTINGMCWYQQHLLLACDNRLCLVADSVLETLNL
jgi:hypothetical protein